MGFEFVTFVLPCSTNWATKASSWEPVNCESKYTLKWKDEMIMNIYTVWEIIHVNCGNENQMKIK